MIKPHTPILCLLALSSVFSTAIAEEVSNVSEAAEANEMVINDGVEMGKFTQDYDAALAYARGQKLPVMLVFTGSDWCGWCKTMDKNVFSKPEWEAYSKETIVQVWLDYPRNKELVPEKYHERNDFLRTEYGIRGYPTYVILDSAGERVGKLGAGRDKTPGSFKAEMEKVLVMTESGMKAYAGKMKAEDGALVKTAYQAYKAAESEVSELEKKLDAAKKEAVGKKDALEEAMESGKVNAFSEEDRAAYLAAKAVLAEAQEKLNAWREQKARARQTPELREEFQALQKAVEDAENKANIFML